MTAATDISNLDFDQLQELIRLCETRKDALRKEGADDLRTRFEQEAAKFGLSLADVANNSVSGKRRGRRPKSATSESLSHSTTIGSGIGLTTTSFSNGDADV